MIGTGTLVVIVVLILSVLGISLVLLPGVLTGGSDVRERVQAYAFVPELGAPKAARRTNVQLYRLRRRLNAMLSAIGSEDLYMKLMSANWRITVTEYVLIRLGLMVTGFLIGWLLLGSLISGVGLAILANLAPGILLRRAVSRRQIEFEKQLVDVLVLINGAVRAGFSLAQAIEVVEREVKPPASDEFRRVRLETGIGLSLTQALNNLASRMENDDLNLVVTAVNIHSQVGGNLSMMLMAVTETVRDRNNLFREARVLTTQQRYTSYLLSLLPVFIAVLMFMINAEYFSKLFTSGTIYLLIPIFAVCGIIAGQFVMQRIARIDV
jgi:tight adherence protein B